MLQFKRKLFIFRLSEEIKSINNHKETLNKSRYRMRAPRSDGFSTGVVTGNTGNKKLYPGVQFRVSS